MDPLSAGASVITFLGLAFSLTKTVHEVLSTVKDGPQIIQHLKEEFSQLRSILERLTHISMSVTDATELDVLARKCNDDVVGFEMRLRRLDMSGVDGRRGRLWRKLKLCFTEKDLEQMRHIIRGHVQLLTIRLNLLQVQQASFSSSQSTEILNLLQKLREDVVTLHQVNSVQTAAKDSTPPAVVELDMADDVPYADSDLANSITRLMHLLEKKPCVVDSEDAEELVDDLERLLHSVQDEASATMASGPAFDSKVSHSDGISKDLKLMRSVILSAPSINVNRSGPLGLLKTLSQGTIIHQERKREVIDIGGGVVRWTSTKLRRRHSTQFGASTSRQTDHARDFSAKLVFEPKNTNKMLTISVNQGQVVYDSFTSILPQITVNNILPPESLVFRLAASGSIQELLALVADGKASLHDHDTSGQSLLHHSVLNFPVCKFLIEQGLDVNEQSEHGTPLYVATFAPEMFRALMVAGADPTIEGDTRCGSVFWRTSLRRDSTAKFLLREMYTTSPFVQYADQEWLGGNPFLNCCRILFRSNYAAAQVQTHLEKLSTLLNHDYSVNTRWADGTNCLSQTFLSFEDRGYFEKQAFVQARKTILTYLVNNRADVNSTDNKGRCVSDFAYNRVFCTPCSESFVPYMGDLWDSVLDECGYDILQFRKCCPRKAKYKGNYTRQVFEQLWEGREHRCPYWNDATWPEVSLGHLPRPWAFLDENGKICERCQSCFESHIQRRGFICGKCGFCTSVLGCQCAQGGDNRHRMDCSRPLRRRVLWDEGLNRYFYLDDSGSSEHDVSNDMESSGGAVMDDEVCSVSMPAERNEREPRELSTILEEYECWNEMASGSSALSEFAVLGARSQNELFENPWGRD
ncbi:hypothetical protein CDV31_015971 [Fusarium ambrosium]|uniref:Azaphilone pigments biosynthesis cluster protein L N-terminal domain-containing protein n=1 Tax=Fusarium ambrosium TaxID=131363 RepID=A0A428SGJ5_9HYPO|nr:hypothetical protein CDV31_015971 [Fusarium ambrosium]